MRPVVTAACVFEALLGVGTEVTVPKLRSRGIHVALDTSGFTDFELLERIRRNIDPFLYDLNVIDDRLHWQYTGASNLPTIANLCELSRRGAQLLIRLPKLSGINDRDGDVRQALCLLKTLKAVERISLLPYHGGGTGKFARLHDHKPQGFAAPQPEGVG
jgi:pyruvate formate lyase activating enzyme